MKEKNELNRLRLIIQTLKDIPVTTGVYAMSSNGKKRTEWQDGWNASLMDYSKRLYKVIEDNFDEYTNDILFLQLSGAGWMQDGKFVLCMNDTFAWGCADAEEVPKKDLHEVVELYHRFGCSGLAYWVAQKRGYDPDPEMKDALWAVKHVRKHMKEEK
jgi:hypothetical protein